MKNLCVVILTLFVLGACRKTTNVETDEYKVDPRAILEDAIEKDGEATFYGWRGSEFNGGAYIRMRFFKEGNFLVDAFGYNILLLPGTYRHTSDSLVEVTFNSDTVSNPANSEYISDWPLLGLREDGDNLELYRVDGKTDWHADWPLYPSAMQDVWPMRLVTDPNFSEGFQVAIPQKPNNAQHRKSDRAGELED